MTTNNSNIFATATILATFIASGALAANETVTVTTIEDSVDFGGAQQVGDLPGPDGQVSFREACLAVNNTAGPQTVAFAIPQSEWWLFTDRALLRQENGIFMLSDNETTLDFTTQTDFTGDTNPNGGEVGIYGVEPNAWGIAAIYVNGDNCVIKGLDFVGQRGYGVRLQGHNNRVIGCTISGPFYAGVYITGPLPNIPATGNVVGGILPGEGNSLSAGNSGVRIDGPAENNIVIGNTLLTGSAAGVEVRSASCCPGYVASDNRIGGPTLAERNLISGAGYYGEEGFPSGSQVSIEYAINTIVENNYIGTTADGNTAYPNQKGTGGVSIVNSTGTIVRDNLISGIAVNGVNHAAGQRFGVGVSIAGNSSNTAIYGNKIGANAAGTGPVSNRIGVSGSFWPGTPAPTGVNVGGTLSGQGNVIAFNETQGVLVQAVVNHIRVSGNSIHSNGALGIDLMTYGSTSTATGPTPNDAGDADVGGNGLQNFPMITSATSNGSSTTIAGTFNSTPNAAFALEFFASSVCDSSGYGEGTTFLGATAVSTDASGNAAFDAVVPMAAPSGSFITATATNALGDTSEFAPCVQAAAPMAGDVTGDGVVNVNDLLAVINQWGACPKSGSCPADVAPMPSGDGIVNVNDLLMVINNWA